MSRSSTQFTALRHHRFFQGGQGGVRAPPRPKPWLNPKSRLVDRVQHLGHRALDNLVLERGNAEGSEATVAFRIYVRVRP